MFGSPCLLERRFLAAAAVLGSGSFRAAGLPNRSRSMSRLNGETWEESVVLPRNFLDGKWQVASGVDNHVCMNDCVIHADPRHCG